MTERKNQNLKATRSLLKKGSLRGAFFFECFIETPKSVRVLNMKRREFLFQLPVGLLLAKACALGENHRTSPLRGEVYATGVLRANVPQYKSFQVIPDYSSYVIFFTPAGDARAAAVPFEVHSVVQNPRHKNLALLVPKWGQSLAIFDLERMEISQLTSVNESKRRFFGHAVWETNGEFFWVTERDDDKMYSLVCRWSKELGRDTEHLTNSDQAHEVQWTSEGQLLVANSGSREASTGLSWIDPKSGKVERFIDCRPKDGIRFVSHFYQLPSQGKVFGVGKNNRDKNESLLLSVDVGTGNVRPLPVPDWARPHFIGESLSIDFDEKRRQLVVTSVAGSGFQSLWDPEKEIFVGGSPGTGPRGVLRYQGEVFVTHNRDRIVSDVSNRHLLKNPFPSAGLDARLWEWGAHIGRLQL